MDDFIKFIITLTIGILGAYLANYIGFPAPYLAGPVIAVSIAAACGIKVSVLKQLTNIVFVFVGILMGSTIIPEVLDAVIAWPFSFIAVVLTIYILLYVGFWLLHLVFGYDRNTAMLASAPGHLSYVMSVATEIKADVAIVSIIQSTRLIILTLAVPIIIDQLDLISPSIQDTRTDMTLIVLVITIIAAVLLGLLFQRLNFPAALLLGGMAVSTATHISGLTTGGVPSWLSVPTYIYLGCLIGTRFAGLQLKQLKLACFAGLIMTLVVISLSGTAAYIVTQVTEISLSATMIAFAPGGLETMAAMAIILGVDTAYVGSHHILRLFILSIMLPVALKYKAKRN